MTGISQEDALSRWSRLTDKQRACLDLLIERKTSKEIARILAISKPTVDQRITAARITLGASNRDQAALLYSNLKHIYDRVTYDPMQVPQPPVLVPSDFQDGDPSSVLVLSDASAHSIGIRGGEREFFPPFREGWRHDHTIGARVMIMTVILTALVIVVFLGLGIAETLKRLISS